MMLSLHAAASALHAVITLAAPLLHFYTPLKAPIMFEFVREFCLDGLALVLMDEQEGDSSSNTLASRGVHSACVAVGIAEVPYKN